MTIEQKIAVETETIAKLEKSYPSDYKSTEWYIHDTELRDAYWRRRMLTAELEGLDKTEVAKIY